MSKLKCWTQIVAYSDFAVLSLPAEAVDIILGVVDFDDL